MRKFFLFLLAFLVGNFILGQFLGNLGAWSLVLVFGELLLFFIVDRFIHFLFFRALWKKLIPLRVLYEIDPQSRKPMMDILDTCTYQYLSAMAFRIQQLTEDQRIYAEKAKRFPGSNTAQAMVANDLVAHALKDFWRVHWLARSLGVDVYSSWKYYVTLEGTE